MGRFSWGVLVLVLGLIAGATTGCTLTVAGLGAKPSAEPPLWAPVVDADAVMLTLAQMRGITGGGEDLSVIPSMDSDYPVDIDLLARDAPPPCRFLFVETEVFGKYRSGSAGVIDDFHKVTYQNPPAAALISQAAATYPDEQIALRVFSDLVATSTECAQTSFGQVFLGDVVTEESALHTRASAECGRDYRLKSVVLAEVTFCAYAESVPRIVMTNLLRNVPG
ncbi:sensor domain-containing protein [Mycolicibacterium confluentis]|uniref:Sensor domain-containing protein n=1 Tax=Mycolicibacterium confluentis TaxID=28047 RepID=A0A7I7XYQ8_9MYCO|nr:sensor domain-containing protein [Mycolicibacterium confluentis]MCV7321485.1 sensor domain-containing protein [Mycolicibacterium confluentis]BBZ34427.1 sensor domain-containing protein [Mycolicibacterium confluentis]